MKALCLAFLVVTAITPIARADVTFGGGDGTTAKSAVVISGAANEMQGVEAEYKWLARHRSRCKLITQSLQHSDGRSMDVMDLQCGSQKETIYFDITAFFGKM